MSGGCLEVIKRLQIKRCEWGVRMMNDSGGEKASQIHSSLSLNMSLSKAFNPPTVQAAVE